MIICLWEEEEEWKGREYVYTRSVRPQRLPFPTDSLSLSLFFPGRTFLLPIAIGSEEEEETAAEYQPTFLLSLLLLSGAQIMSPRQWLLSCTRAIRGREGAGRDPHTHTHTYLSLIIRRSECRKRRKGGGGRGGGGGKSTFVFACNSLRGPESLPGCQSYCKRKEGRGSSTQKRKKAETPFEKKKRFLSSVISINWQWNVNSSQ